MTGLFKFVVILMLALLAGTAYLYSKGQIQIGTLYIDVKDVEFWDW